MEGITKDHDNVACWQKIRAEERGRMAEYSGRYGVDLYIVV